MERMIHWPTPVLQAIQTLEAAGFEGWAVGGCVRDILMGNTPHDWDMTTSALPEEMLALFGEQVKVTAGIKHGTVGVLIDGMLLEITTYRLDGDYKDARHPDGVVFTRSLKEDLARRDFTINAMALHPEKGLFDPFGGQEDLKAGLLRAVGEPDKRMQEDALRILRGLRFLSRFGFTAEQETKAAFFRHKALLKIISAERICTELTGMLCGSEIKSVLMDYPDIIGIVIPEILPMVGFDQKTPYHIYDVWEHTAVAVGAVKPEPVLRWTMLLHDIGKPEMFTLDEKGVGHFKGHAARSVAHTQAIVSRLKMPVKMQEEILTLVERHDLQIPAERKPLLRWLSRLGEEQLLRLWQVKRADNLAQNRTVSDRQTEIARLEEMTLSLISEGHCLSLKDLAVNGHDLMALGISGKSVGETLKLLLDKVIEESVPNDRESLLASITE